MNDFQRRPRVDSNLFLLVRKRQMIVTILKQFHARLHSHTSYICEAWLWEVLNYPCLRFFCVWSLYGHNRGIKNAKYYLRWHGTLKSLKKLFIHSISQMRTICTYFARTVLFVLLESVSCQELIVNSMSFSDFAKTCFFRFTKSIPFRVANLLGFSFIAINNKIRPIYCNKSNKIQ